MSDLICQVAKVKAARSAHSMADVIPFFKVFNIPFESNASIKPEKCFPHTVKKHRHAKRARVTFLVIGVFVELFTVMIWLCFLGCDIQQEGNWKSIIYKYNVTSVMVR